MIDPVMYLWPSVIVAWCIFYNVKERFNFYVEKANNLNKLKKMERDSIEEIMGKGTIG